MCICDKKKCSWRPESGIPSDVVIKMHNHGEEIDSFEDYYEITMIRISLKEFNIFLIKIREY